MESHSLFGMSRTVAVLSMGLDTQACEWRIESEGSAVGVPEAGASWRLQVWQWRFGLEGESNSRWIVVEKDTLIDGKGTTLVF